MHSKTTVMSPVPIFVVSPNHTCKCKVYCWEYKQITGGGEGGGSRVFFPGPPTVLSFKGAS